MTNEVEPTVLEKYNLEKRLGKGAYGIVWKATEKATSKIVALKKIFDAFRNETDSQVDDRWRTFREICYLKEFSDHENIIKLYNVIRSENKKDIYLIFEFMPADLESLITRANVLKNIHKKSVIYQILKGLLYIHSSNVVHRDLKPSNILIDANCLVKICDFGMARSLHTTTNEVGEVAMTDYVATRWYRAPEILLASPKYTTKIDMWSLGCIHGELFRGKPLFPGNSTLNQIDYIMSVCPPHSKEDVSSINSTYASNLLLRRTKKYSQKSLSTLLTSNTPPEALNLLKAFLTFNPNKRISAQDALKHPYFVDFYQPEELKTLYYDVIPPIDEANKLSVSEYREMLFKDSLSDTLKCRRAKHSFIEYKPLKESTYQSAWRNSIVKDGSSDNDNNTPSKSIRKTFVAKESWKSLLKSFQSEKRLSSNKNPPHRDTTPITPKIHSSCEPSFSNTEKITSYIEPIQINTDQKLSKSSAVKSTPSKQIVSNKNVSSEMISTESPEVLNQVKEPIQKILPEHLLSTESQISAPMRKQIVIQTQQQQKQHQHNEAKEVLNKKVEQEFFPQRIQMTKSASLSYLPRPENSFMVLQLIENSKKNNVAPKPRNPPNDPQVSKDIGFFKLIKNYLTNKTESLKKSIVQSTACINNLVYQTKCEKNVKKSTIKFRTTTSTITL